MNELTPAQYKNFITGRYSEEDSAFIKDGLDKGEITKPPITIEPSLTKAYHEGNLAEEDRAEIASLVGSGEAQFPEEAPAAEEKKEYYGTNSLRTGYSRSPQKVGLGEAIANTAEQTMDTAGQALAMGKDAYTGESKMTTTMEGMEDWGAMPEVNQPDFATLLSRLGTAYVSDPKMVKGMIESLYPDVQVGEDEKKNLIFTSAIDGKQYGYKPGFQKSDLLKIPAAMVSPLRVAGKLAPLASKIPGVGSWASKAMQVMGSLGSSSSKLGRGVAEGVDEGMRLATADMIGADVPLSEYGFGAGVASSLGFLSRGMGVMAETPEGQIKELDRLATLANEHGVLKRKGGNQGMVGGEEASNKFKDMIVNEDTRRATLEYLDQKGLGFNADGDLVKTKLDIKDETAKFGTLHRDPSRIRQAIETDQGVVQAGEDVGTDSLRPLDIVSKDDPEGRKMLTATQDADNDIMALEKLTADVDKSVKGLGENDATRDLGILSKDVRADMDKKLDIIEKNIDKRYTRVHSEIDFKNPVTAPHTLARIEREIDMQIPELPDGTKILEGAPPEMDALELELKEKFTPFTTGTPTGQNIFVGGKKGVAITPEIEKGEIGRTLFTMDKLIKRLGSMTSDPTFTHLQQRLADVKYADVKKDFVSSLDEMVSSGKITEKARDHYIRTIEVAKKKFAYEAKLQTVFGQKLKDSLAKTTKAASRDAINDGWEKWNQHVLSIPKGMRQKVMTSSLLDALDVKSGKIDFKKFSTMLGNLDNNSQVMNTIMTNLTPEGRKALKGMKTIGEAIYGKEKLTTSKSHVADIINKKEGFMNVVLQALGGAALTTGVAEGISAGGFLKAGRFYVASAMTNAFKSLEGKLPQQQYDRVMEMFQSPELLTLLKSDMNETAVKRFEDAHLNAVLKDIRKGSVKHKGIESKISAMLRLRAQVTKDKLPRDEE